MRTFRLIAYQRAMKYLGVRHPEMIDTTITTEELTSGEGFYIGYWNHLTIIEGHHLKQKPANLHKGTLATNLASAEVE